MRSEPPCSWSPRWRAQARRSRSTDCPDSAWYAWRMSESWAAVDHLLESFLLPQDEALSAALAAPEQAGLPPIQVPPVQGRFLHLLARSIGARRVLEFGTLGGYSTIWLARALPDGGRLARLELNRSYAEVARTNLERAGVADRADVVVGPAIESLRTLAED